MGRKEAADRGRAQRLKACTLNTWGLPFPIAFHPRRLRFPRIARFLEQGAFHLVALQEVWNGAPRLNLPGLVLPDGKHGDSGLALLSSLPIRDVVVRPYLTARGFDRWKHKGVMRAQAELPDGRALTVVSTHLQAGPSEADAKVRATQTDELLEEVAAAPPGAIVVMGDFNLHDRQREDAATEARIAAFGLEDAAAGAPAPTYAWGRHRFDRIFVRNLSVESVVIPQGIPFLSDHLPVAAELTA